MTSGSVPPAIEGAVSALLAELAGRFLEVDSTRIDAEIEEALGRLAQLVDADAAALVSVSAEGTELLRSHEWHRPDVGPIGLRASWPAAPLRGITREMAADAPRLFPLVGGPSLPEDLQTELDAAGVRGIGVLPIAAEGRTQGGIELFWRSGPPPIDPIALQPMSTLANIIGAVLRGRRVERALAESLDRLRQLTRAIPGIVYQFRMAPDGTASFPFVGDSAVDLGVEAAALMKDPYFAFEMVVPEDLPGLLDSIRQATERGSRWNHEFRIRHPDGRILWLRASSIPEARGEDGSIVWNGLMTDITDVKRLEEQFALAARMSSMGTMAASVAHEINNPLAYTTGNLAYALSSIERLREGDSSPAEWDDLSEALREALDGAHRVRDIVGDLKAFSRIDPYASKKPVDVQRVVDVALRMCGNELRHRARVAQDRFDCPLVAGDESRLTEVLVNLLVNAAQAMPEGENADNEIRIVTRAEGDEVCIEVRDNGSGIPPENLARVFEPFFTTKPVGVGTGLGLPICHRIMAELGGRLSLDSALGVGTVARVCLPALDSPPVVHRERRTAAPPPPRRPRILIVDDDPMILSSLARILAREHDVAVASSGADALARLGVDSVFDVVLCDLMMPGVSGEDLYESVCRQHPELEARFLFMTGGTFTAGLDAFRRRVVDRVLDKPLDPQRLRLAVRQALGRGAPAIT